MGAWAAVRGELWSLTPYCLAAAVLCWVFGFDLIYSILDADFDRKKGLFSFPARFGVPAALRFAKVLHGIAAACFLMFGRLAGLGLFYWSACLIVLGALVFEHQIANPESPASLNQAFFNVNALVSLSLLAGVWHSY